MRERIARYTREPIHAATHEVGCIIVRDPFWLDEEDWFEPPDWKPNIVQGKTYDLAGFTGRRLWEMVQERLQRTAARRPRSVEGPMFGDPVLARRRLGQGAFMMLVHDAYRRRCAVTGERALPVLQAGHIRPVAEGGLHRVDNGVLLRSDVHTLFDRGYVTMTPDDRFRVSRRLRDDFHNGEAYYALEGTDLSLPRSSEDRPSKELLEWHNDQVFLP